ncbi:MAG: HAD family hydrolase [Thermodesulfovibrionales bacterium]
MPEKRAVFLDRDGVVNRKMPEGDYVKAWEEFVFLPGVFEALALLKKRDLLVIIVTNQRCIARGIISEAELEGIHSRMRDEIRKRNGGIDAIYHCPHDREEGCGCRKPEPGMLLRAVSDFGRKGVRIDIANSYLIGDSESDILAGKAAGVRTIRIGDSPRSAGSVKRSLLEAVESINECFPVCAESGAAGREEGTR